MPFYGGDYRPDDEPPPEAVLEEKRILEHQFRRPSPSRLSSTASSIRPPTTVRQGGGISANRSLRAKPSGSSPRRSLQRSSAFGNRRSATITDRGRTASMPAVPIVRHELNNRKATIVSSISKIVKSIIMIIQTLKSTEILNIFNDLKSIEKRLNIRAVLVTLIITYVGIIISVIEVLFDYPLYSLSNYHWAVLEVVSRICLFTIDLQFCYICIRIATIFKHLNTNLQLIDISRTGPRRKVIGLSTVVAEFGLLCDLTGRTNGAYVGQLSLIVGLHFSSALVHVYLFCFHALTKAVRWDVMSIGGARALNNLWRLSVVSGSAHYASKQALYVYERMGQIRTSRMKTEDIEEVCTATHLSKPFITVNSLHVPFCVVFTLVVNRCHCLVV
ncbi:hypothetical protein QTP88_008115 [Uroleucon formosanum]